MRSGAKAAIVGGVFLVATGGVAYGGYTLLSGESDETGPDVNTRSAPRKTGPPSVSEVDRTTKAFLTAWSKGDVRAAADLTNNAAAARPALDAYRTVAHVSAVTLTPGAPVGAKVPFTVKATVTYPEAKSKPWSYASELTVVRGLTTGAPLVDWAPAVVHPRLKADDRLTAGEAAAPPIKAVDRDGAELTKEKYPSLGPVLDTLREKYGKRAGGKPGVELAIEGADGEAPVRSLLTLTKGRPGKLTTTLDAGIQAAAEKAVRRYRNSSVVAVKPSTGEIRAVANNRDDAFNAAMLGKQAPGSTMKIVTAAMLLEKGLVGADRPVECPADVMYQGRTFHNLDNFDIKNGTFTQSFAKSCNTAFIKQIDDTKDDAALAKEAQEVFGIGLDWQTGVTSADGSVPMASGGEAAAQYIGQGTVQMNVLNMASVTATAKTGTFRQPVLVPRSLDGREIAQAPRSLPGGVSEQLRTMMRVTASSGTGAQAMASVGGDKGAKTGSAEVDGQGTSNSWFTGFSDDVAAAAVVESGGHGGDAAGPLVATVLRAG
ncbi:penicillin-binding transpeptidase domain-containing protein [Streptomyces sp. A5-4]|uniref:penicillin-binding transpeptidase domain-containing protein n=1 Tax=Streptomyces sp. A5-4 TaxID=3384771 RepID=UPI003DA8EC2D